MVKAYSYKILQNQKLILEYVCGEITWREVIELKKRLTQDINYDPTFHIIDDIRDLKINYTSEKEIQEFIEFANSQPAFLGARKSAVLTKTPNQVANSEILIYLNKDLPINFRTFSALSAATKWIGLGATDMQIIELYLKELKVGG